LLEYGANLRVIDSLKMNAMHYAAESGRARFVQWLFDKGAQHMMFAKTRAPYNSTPLDLAIEKEKQDVLDLLLQRYKDFIAAQEGHLGLDWILRTSLYEKDTIVLSVGTLQMRHMLALLTLFVSEQTNAITTRNSAGSLPLHVACQNPKTPVAVIQFLVEQDPTTAHHTDHQGNLPIHTLCASQPPLDTVKYLQRVSHDASFTMLNSQGGTPLMEAAWTSASVDVLLYLMKANPSAAVDRTA
jgi:ankyrin repeat protein